MINRLSKWAANKIKKRVYAERTARIRQNICPYCEKRFWKARLFHLKAGWRPGLMCPDLHFGFIYFQKYAQAKTNYAQLDNLGEPLEIGADRIEWIEELKSEGSTNAV